MPTDVLTVKDLMTSKVTTIGMDESLKTVRSIFTKRRFHHLVVTEKGKPVGVLSDRDLLKHISPFIGVPMGERPQDAATLKKRVHQIMTRKLVSVHPDTSAVETAVLMTDQKVSCLPVIDAEQRLVGIITTHDLVRWAVECHAGALPPTR